MLRCQEWGNAPNRNPEVERRSSREQTRSDMPEKTKIQTVRAIIYKWRKHGTVENLPRSGWLTKITPRAQRQLIQEFTKDPTTTSKELQALLAQLSTNFIPDRSRPGLTTTAIGAVDLQGAGGNWATVGRRSRGGRRVRRQREKRKGKGRELADVMERRKVDILCVQETRWKGSKARSIGAGFKLFYYGVDSKRNGVGCELEEKERFWSELDEVMESIPTVERVVIGADFNGHVGEGNTGDEEKREEHRVTYKSGGRSTQKKRQKLRQALGGQVVLPDDWETTAELIRETGRKVLGVSSGRKKGDKETWWWNEEVQDSIQRKRLAKKKWDMDRTEENRQEYKELQRRVKREVSKAKQKAYDELYTRLDTREGEKDLYRLARQRDRDGKDVQQVRVIKDRDGRVLTSEESVQRRWKEYFEELMNEENEREKRVEGVNSVEQKVDKIRKDEVRKALKRMKSGKAVGPDDIPVEVWKCLGEAAVEFLASLFNRVLENLEKAYDRVPREELWYCMRKSGVAEKYVRVVQDMYERSRTVVRCAVGQTEEFNVEVGLHQGSALSPFLFAIVMDQLSEEVRQESPWTMMFADDIVICSESREQVEENLERWRFALERRGMKVSRSKTEYMCVNEREGSGTVRLQGEEVKKVQEFKYLGSTVQSNGECGKEVKKRVQAGWNGWRKVSGVLCDQKISARIKGKVYRTVVRPAMLYGLETVSLRKRQESELEVAELKMLRFSLGVTRLDRIRNEYIRGTAHVGRLGDKVREARLRWFGHVQRRENPDASCVPQIKVRKNTVYTPIREHQLNISCPVTYCNEIPVVQWIKIDDRNNFIHINETNQVTITEEQTGLKEKISYLSFKNILPDYNGIYRCKVFTPGFSSESHSINLTVSDPSNNTNVNNINGLTKERETDVRQLLYVFICLGILGLVMIVMLISFLCINRYSRKTHRNKSCLKPVTTTTPGKSQEIPEEQSNIYDATENDLHLEPDSLYTGNNQKCAPDMRNGNRDSDRSEQIVYATLQHPTSRGPPAVRHQARDQQSEYASIRIS
ncbi:hypothetical protein QTP70_006126 [Hemibagrus guttatus]|uniref:ribonuclease H n=1 Tax=Hemibagrus guttatus TaxID=175788 RepID=A0AAE0R5D5_9TELE|nr:hypothetical protein QTP70_006126 [Hemibagrus guttatus]